MSTLLLSLMFANATIDFGLPSNLLSSICYIESTHKVNVIHKHDGDGNSVGICQIKWKTANWLGFKGTEKELMNPKVNIYYAAKYLRYQIDRYDGSVIHGVTAYNKGNAKKLTNTTYYDKVIKHWVGDRKLVYENQ